MFGGNYIGGSYFGQGSNGSASARRHWKLSASTVSMSHSSIKTVVFSRRGSSKTVYFHGRSSGQPIFARTFGGDFDAITGGVVDTFGE